jgi:hypothetical protein
VKAVAGVAFLFFIDAAAQRCVRVRALSLLVSSLSSFCSSGNRGLSAFELPADRVGAECVREMNAASRTVLDLRVRVIAVSNRLGGALAPRRVIGGDVAHVRGS